MISKCEWLAPGFEEDVDSTDKTTREGFERATVDSALSTALLDLESQAFAAVCMPSRLICDEIEVQTDVGDLSELEFARCTHCYQSPSIYEYSSSCHQKHPLKSFKHNRWGSKISHVEHRSLTVCLYCEYSSSEHSAYFLIVCVLSRCNLHSCR